MGKEQPFIQLENVSKWYGKSMILDKLNFNVPYGEIFGIIGKSGCGKSTTLSIIIGFLKPSEGKVYFQSHDIYNDIREVQEQFGFAAQEVSFYPKLTVKENLEYFGKLYNLKHKRLKERIPEVLKLVNLEGTEHLQGWKLSAGMQKRLDIACAMIHEPKVLLLDEPTEDLDPTLRLGLLDLIKKINHEKNVTVILTSHLLNEVEYVCDRVAILDDHKIVAIGKINELKDDYSKDSEIGIELEDRNNQEFIKLAKKIPNAKKIIERQGKIYIYTDKGAEILKSMLQASLQQKKKFNVTSITLSKPSLEEVFQSLTGKTKEEVVEEVKEEKKEVKTEEKKEVKKVEKKEVKKSKADEQAEKELSKMAMQEKIDDSKIKSKKKKDKK